MLLNDLLSVYQEKIEGALKEEIAVLGCSHPLQEACTYALLNGGKRFRPALVLMVADALGYGVDAMPAAVGVEFFHTASLIADDLPCMDNDDERRSLPALHRVFGESTALLSTYALIAQGYSCISKNGEKLKGTRHPMAHQSDLLVRLAIENVCYNTGVRGAAFGQFLDLTIKDPSVQQVFEILDKKTVTLFEISFVLGWIFGGGDLASLGEVKKCAAHFGRAFQIADDIADMEQDLLHGCKGNLALLIGKREAIHLFQQEISLVHELLRDLHLLGSDVSKLCLLFDFSDHY